MRYLRRYCLLLCALVMFVGLFSTTAHADTNNSSKLSVSIMPYNSTLGIYSYDTFFNGSTASKWTDSNDFTLADTYYTLMHSLVFTDEADSILLEGGKNYEFRVDNLLLDWTLNHRQAGYLATIHTDAKVKFQSGRMEYTDGTGEAISVTLSYVDTTNSYSIVASVSPTKDVKKITGAVNVYYKPTGFVGDVVYIESAHGSRGSTPIQIKVIEERKEVGLLQGIGNKLSGLWDSVTDGFSKLQTGITNVVNGITELPTKIWDKISEGLKNLFVPSEESMTAYKDKWDSLLSDRLGAVYQVVNITIDSWGEVMEADETDIIEFPKATINLSGTPFSFGGYEVKIVPDGFDVLITAIKAIVAIVCTVMVVNGLRKRYDEVMGVEQ